MKPKSLSGQAAIQAAIDHALDAYFAALDGENAHDLHALMLMAAEKSVIAHVHARTGGNQSASAEMLGLSRATLKSKLVKYGLTGATDSPKTP